MKIIKLFFVLLIFTSLSYSQDFSIRKIEPPDWWTGMKHNKIQLMVYGENLHGTKVQTSTHNIKIKSVHEVENSSYLFVDIEIPKNASAGENKIFFIKNGKKVSHPFHLQKRDNKNLHSGFSSEDIIYLLMPDRFANGDSTNDFVEGYCDSLQSIPSQARKGGDIAGITSKLNYLKNFGATAIWITPLLENNTFRSYHGYSTTNHYKIDPRLGGIEQYQSLVDSAHKIGLKVIMDHVANHIAIDHEWMKNLPMSDWINGSIKNHLSANHNKMAFLDIHSDSTTIKEVQEGWFTNYMPDLNHGNKYLAKYLIQNTIWWIEKSGVDGIREDTYPYCNQKFMSKWAKEIIDEYPSLKILGEVWTGESDYLAGYQSGSKFQKFDSHLFSVTDFALRDAFIHYLQGRASIYELFNTIAKDYLYCDANNLTTFVDNHDVGRAMFYADSNVAKFKLVFHILLTTRGIPQIFYGTEIGMIQNEDHGTLRKPFPGGFFGDKRNAFVAEERTDYENDIFNYLQSMIKMRKENPALTKGNLIHYPPVNDVYVYSREYKNEITMTIINSGEKDFSPDVNYYQQLNDVVKAKNLLDGKEISPMSIIVKPMTAATYKLLK